MQQRKIPQRMCCGCGEMKSKQELIRIVKSPPAEDGSFSITLDTTGKQPGRGAYICRSADCLALARKKRRFEKAFSCKLSDDIYSALEKELSDI